nr:Transposon Ty3-G Gag-Pol polyprotein [Ipomoea batatas]
MSTSNTTQNPHVASEDGNQNPSEQPWEASISALQQQLNQQAIFTHHSTQALQRSMHQLQQTIDSMRTSPPSMPTQQDMLDPPHIGHHTTLSDSNNRSTHLKFDPPKFSGTDPDGWIFRAQEYFEYNNVSSEQRLRVTSLLMGRRGLRLVPLDEEQPPLNFMLTTVGAYRSAYEKLFEQAMCQEKIEKGLCFSCDQKWSRNHKCPNRFLLLEAHEEDIEEAMESNEQLLTGDVSSLNSLSGSGTPRSLRLMGYIGKG